MKDGFQILIPCLLPSVTFEGFITRVSALLDWVCVCSHSSERRGTRGFLPKKVHFAPFSATLLCSYIVHLNVGLLLSLVLLLAFQGEPSIGNKREFYFLIAHMLELS